MSPTRRFPRLRAQRTAALGVLGGLVLLLMGDGVRSASNPGIDPLEILNIQIKPNVFIVFDTSGSMRFPLDEFRNLGGDDPVSRLFQAKDALRQVLAANATRVNFGFGTYNVRNDDKVLRFPFAVDCFSSNPVPPGCPPVPTGLGGSSVGAPILYVSTAANGATWSGILPNFFVQPVQGAAYTGTASAEVYSSFAAVTRNFVWPSCPVASPDCRRYLYSRLLRDNVVYRWNTGAAPPSSGLQVIGTGPFVCPNPPVGLFPQDPNVDADPTTTDLRRPCFAHESTAPGNPRAIFFYSSGIWDMENGASQCGGAALLNAVVPCNQNAAPTITNNYLKPELPVDGSCGEATGFPCDVVPVIGNFAAAGAQILLGPGPGFAGTNPSTVAGNNPNTTLGVIAAQATPLADSIDYVDTNFNTVFPNQFPGQRNFVLILTDGDDTCADDPDGDGVCNTDRDGDGDCDTDDRAIDAAIQAQQLYNRAPLNGETLVVAFTSTVSKARADKIAQAGSGGLVNGVTGVVTCPPNVPCRDAYSASNATELARVLNAAIQQTVNSGEFSDQQSITQSIYELVTVVENPTGTGLYPFNPMDPQNRYAKVPVLLQSTFEMPDYKGHLKAFRRAGPLPGGLPGDECLPSETLVNPTTCRMWDAAEKLCQRVTGATNCIPPAGPLLTGTATFAQLHAGEAVNLPNNIAPPNPAAGYIARRIFTTTQNGVNPSYTAPNLATNGATSAIGSAQLAMWPPTTSNSGVDPSNDNFQGSLDDPLGITYPALALPLQKANALRADFGACVGSNLPAGCSGTAAAQYQAARKEAREMILAFVAGARPVKDASGNPARGSAGPLALQILYEARPFILAESTLAAPAVIPPPIQKETTQESDEYISFRDGPRTAANVPVNGVNFGFGLRNPDNSATSANIDIKPIMTVVYHATNEMLHALRAGPCPSAGVPGFPYCAGENGGEELWGFVPFDLLGKIKDRMKPQSRTNHTYMLASPIRFNDVFVRGAVSLTISGATVSGDGVWRRVAIVGRGAGGKSLTALDVTAPGQFTKAVLATNPPVVVWNRGNPDTSTGIVGGANNNNVADYNAYLKMGETWSVPAMVFVTAANNTTPRRPGGVEFAAYVGSGYTDVATEGKTFYALDALSGDVIVSHDIANRALPPATVPNHALVASPSAYQQAALEGSFLTSPRNPTTEKATLIFFPDIHGRVWRFVTDTPGTAPSLFLDLFAAGEGEQPIANGVLLAAENSDASSVKPHVYLEAGNDSRIPAPAGVPFFRMYGYRDTAGVAGQLFFKDFPTGFRGTVQPTGAFNNATPPQLRIFFAGTRFNPALLSCASSFDSILFALTGITGGAAYDLTGGAGAEESITMTGQRVTSLAIHEGQLVVDLGLGAQNPPAPPAPPTGGTAGVGSQLNVSIDTTPPAGTPSFRLGSPVCR